MSSAGDIAQLAESLRLKGNRAMADNRFHEAVEHYTHAISTDSQYNHSGALHVFYSNRSAAHIQCGNLECARDDAMECIRIRPEWHRGYSRGATALFRLG